MPYMNQNPILELVFLFKNILHSKITTFSLLIPACQLFCHMAGTARPNNRLLSEIRIILAQLSKSIQPNLQNKNN